MKLNLVLLWDIMTDQKARQLTGICILIILLELKEKRNIGLYKYAGLIIVKNEWSQKEKEWGRENEG